MTASGYTIALATDGASIARCHPVVLELRPHLVDRDVFVAQVQRQQTQGYHLLYLEVAGEVRSVAGFRLQEKLSAGRFLYVDDLVTRGADASCGYGGALLDWLVAHARKTGCSQFQLDSGVWRFGAHRFYLRKGMDITAHHFDMKLDANRPECGGGA